MKTVQVKVETEGQKSSEKVSLISHLTGFEIDANPGLA